jgi:tRNA(fMet)-specific endonuclease VapC
VSLTYLLDTNICVDAMRGREPAATRVLACLPDEFAISAMTEAELRYGALKGNTRINTQMTEAWLGIVGAILPFDSDAARRHAELRMATRAQRISEHDLIIASVAVANGLTMVTGNVREFSRIPGLKIENWTI